MGRKSIGIYAHKPGFQSPPSSLDLAKAASASVVLPRASRAMPLLYQAVGIVGIKPDGLVKCLDGLIVLALTIKSIAFVVPGCGKVGIKPDGFVIKLLWPHHICPGQ